jgi:two-component system response regulator YesN
MDLSGVKGVRGGTVMYKLVIADDEKNVLDGIADTIAWKENGIIVVGKATNGLDLVRTAVKEEADIILTDIRMPEMDGLEAIEELQEQLPDAEFVVITAFQEFEYAKKAIELGVTGFITKPVLKMEVIEQITQAKEKLKERRLGRKALKALQENKETEEKKENVPQSAIERAIEYMKEHIDEGIMMTEVAEYMHMNPSYFSRYFKEDMGISFIDYVKNLKIERAKELLDTSNMKIYEISNTLSYNSVQYFSTMFKSVTGLTPQEYKNRFVTTRKMERQA